MCTNDQDVAQADIFEKATRALRETPVPDGPPSSTLTDVLAAVSEVAEQPQTRANSNRIIRVKEGIRTLPPIMRTAAAVLIMAGIFGFLTWLNSSSGGRTAFADVVEPFLTAHTATFTLTIHVRDAQPQTAEGMFFEPGSSRWTMPGGEVIITDTQQGKMMTLVPSQKEATLMEVGLPGEVSAQSRFNILPGIRKHIEDAQEVGDESVEFLGEQEKDGIVAIGYRAAASDTAITVWADATSKLPLWIEQSMEMMPRKVTVVISNIAYNVELDRSLFSLEAPEGYSLTSMLTGDVQPTLVVRGVVTDQRRTQK